MSDTEYFTATPVDNIAPMVSAVRATFMTGKTLPEEFRREQLLKLYQAVDENKEALITAVQQYLGRSRLEISLTEISATLGEIAHQINNLSKYMEHKPIQRAAINAFDTCEYRYNPLGVATIIAPWNFPIQLTLLPLAGAIASGCCAIVKPSEISGRVGSIIAELMGRYLDQECYKCVLGNVPVVTELLRQKVDLIFYTGSCAIGKVVMRAAAEHLTPVVLELGGQNPVIVDNDVDVYITAKRIMWGRCMNAGQVCLSPEYVICEKSMQEPLIEAMREVIKEWYGENPKTSPYYGRIVNRNHFDRILKILEESKESIAVGGDSDEFTRYIGPTVLRNVNESSPIMRHETFGPILSIYPVSDINQAVKIVHNRGKPLALYIFSNNSAFVDRMQSRIDAGGVTVNDTVMHYGVKGFAFGGTGMSGMGKYHGFASFEAFSHAVPFLGKSLSMEFLNNVRCPPYTETKASIYRAATEEKIHDWSDSVKQFGLAVGLGAVAYFVNSKL